MSTITHVYKDVDLVHIAKNIILTDVQPQLDSLQTTINNIISNTDETALNSLSEIADQLTSDKSLYDAIKTLSDSNLNKLNGLTSDLAAEITRATAAENAVSTALTTKEQALLNAIDAEVATRENADAAIQSDITSKHNTAISTLNTKAAALQATDASLQTSVSNLVAADTAINNEIANVKTENDGQNTVMHELLKKIAPDHFAS